MKDQSGNLYIFDAIIALSIVFIVLLMLNTLISIPNPTYSNTDHNPKLTQDIMEILSGKVDFSDESFLEKITNILKEDNNSQKSIREASILCKDKFEEFNITNYRFVESSNLNSKVLSSSGKLLEDSNISSATRSFDSYSYTLYIWWFFLLILHATTNIFVFGWWIPALHTIYNICTPLAENWVCGGDPPPVDVQS